MFSLPFVPAFQQSLGGHVFGRFAESPPTGQGSGGRSAPGVSEPSLDDGIEDLAQRVREIGEW